MPEGMYRIGIVGVHSLVGKELADELQESLLAASDFVLLDDEEEGAVQLAAVGDEAAVVQKLEHASFERMDFVFFTGDASATTEHWKTAAKAGASVMDLTYALDGQPGVPVRAPWAGVQAAGEGRGDHQLSLGTRAVTPAHPAAVMLALVAGRVHAALPVANVAATVFEPASQHGRAAMDELHQQTVNLLSFHALPKVEYDAQAAFNLLDELGTEARVGLKATAERIARHYDAIGGAAGAGALPALDLELLVAPVFHGYTASLLVEFAADVDVAAVEQALEGENVAVVREAGVDEAPSNLNASGRHDVMVRVRQASARRYWLWLAADNLKLAAENAIACALELRRFRPRGGVQ